MCDVFLMEIISYSDTVLEEYFFMLKNILTSILFQAQEKLGPVDLLVNCAGTSVTGKFEAIEVNSFEVSERSFLFHRMNELVFSHSKK